MGSAAEMAAPKKANVGGASGGTKLRVTIVLALLLLLVGVAGAGALKLLEHAMRAPTADDTAQLVCTAFQRQDYNLLIQQIDPAPVPPAASDAFNTTVLRQQLMSLDTSQGNVTSCKYSQLNSNVNPLQFTYTLRRAHATSAISLIVLIEHERDGAWKISRGSNLIGTQS